MQVNESIDTANLMENILICIIFQKNRIKAINNYEASI